MKIEITDHLNRLLNEVCKLRDTPRRYIDREFVRVIEGLIKTGKLDLGFHFTQAQSNISQDTDHLADFNAERLEIGKSRSGFVGVYMHGEKWRATVPDPTRGNMPKNLPVRDTAVEAAIDRYKWFEQYGLPYGNLGKNVEMWKRIRPGWSMEEILNTMVEEAEREGKLPDGRTNPYTHYEAVQLRERWLASHKSTPIKKATDAKSILNAKSKAEIPDEAPEGFVVPCVTCGQPIEEVGDMRPFGDDEWRHRNCPNPGQEN